MYSEVRPFCANRPKGRRSSIKEVFSNTMLSGMALSIQPLTWMINYQKGLPHRILFWQKIHILQILIGLTSTFEIAKWAIGSKKPLKGESVSVEEQLVRLFPSHFAVASSFAVKNGSWLPPPVRHRSGHTSRSLGRRIHLGMSAEELQTGRKERLPRRQPSAAHNLSTGDNGIR